MLVTRNEAVALSGTTPAIVKKAIDERVIPSRSHDSQSCLDGDDVPVLTMLGAVSGMRLSLAHKRRLREWLRAPDATDELELTPAVVVRRVAEVDAARERTQRYAELRDRWIVTDPDIKRGEPVIRGSRVSVHTLAARIATGERDEVLDEDLPHIPAEAREVAVRYARANPRRGRPRRAPAPR